MCKSCRGRPFQNKFGQCIIECVSIGRTVVNSFGVHRILNIRPIGRRTASYHFSDTGELEAAFSQHGTLFSRKPTNSLNRRFDWRGERRLKENVGWGERRFGENVVYPTLSTAQADAILIERMEGTLTDLGKLTIKLFKEE